MIENCEYLLFDLDGTLTDSAPGIHNSFRYALHAMGEPEPPLSELKMCVGPPLWESFEHRFGLAGDRLAKVLEEYQVYYTAKGMFENSVYEGVHEALSGLRAAGYKLAVASSKKQIHVGTVLEHFGLAKYFVLQAGSDTAAGRFDKTDVIRHALSELGAAPEKTAMIGDRRHDVDGARAFGVHSVGAVWGYGTREELASAGAEELAESPLELLGIFNVNT